MLIETIEAFPKDLDPLKYVQFGSSMDIVLNRPCDYVALCVFYLDLVYSVPMDLSTVASENCSTGPSRTVICKR